MILEGVANLREVLLPLAESRKTTPPLSVPSQIGSLHSCFGRLTALNKVKTQSVKWSLMIGRFRDFS